ncbi:hypothetical protein [Staphylothermus hellenicus]|uniref:Uncharacterized protein n=1 Tax=Staphylothermus hellenicus (strain DSM 12710 / JCM 10830 / BK20S6-10-b1 / P8) TaxID=591019 RepID=D7DAN2_STAHD|nr:hypothetical protein [Staphylothermus hellenicus]ADI31229.1 hypothetical protein Shell_0080 [Staphylothermus hellenicus DSM 12710]
MNTLLIVGVIVAALLVGVGAAITYYNNAPSTNIGTTTTPSETTTQQPTQTTTTTSGYSGADLSGTWEGTFTAHAWQGSGGTGHWTWIIHRVGSNKYEGVLKTSNVYPTGGWINIEVTVDGNQITVGTVGNYGGIAAVVFTGTVSGDGSQASGTWHFTNDMDNGQWSGRKVSSSTQIPSETTTIQTSASQTTTTQSGTGTTTTTQVPGCVPNPPTQYQAAYQSMYQAAATVFGESNLQCYFQGIVNTQYVVSFHIQNYNSEEAFNYAQQLNTTLTSNGWIIDTLLSSGNEIHVGGYYNTTVNGAPTMFMGLLTIQIEDNGTVDLAIQIQPVTY